MISRFLAILFVLLSQTQAHAQESPGDERARRLAEHFRCVVCQNQSLADSNASLAADLRARIREQVAQGASDEQIQAFMVQRYGDFVLYRPPVKPVTWPLWFGPLAVLAAGALAMARHIRRARKTRQLASAKP
ncbi:cytochrome c-type biogenesis protein [Caballeronia insecticola]|uniref:Cytochrome c-type biogenesis protein n=1 Tax=Caballeronia insecticola TaxID=758793 RepID=R4X191_9BURK|nr:cytochrome c-type biogenesis protein [Caballeronia insecticola]BAN28105.1 putative cytochrome C biogenesis protein CcmH [Caballeronia insecticola]